MTQGKIDISDEEIEAAEWRGKEVFVIRAHATDVRYDHTAQQLVLTLRGGMVLTVPAHLLQAYGWAERDGRHESMAEVAPGLVEEVRLMGQGSALHWKTLDQDFLVQSLVAGSYGGLRWMRRLEERGLLDEASVQRSRVVEELHRRRAENARPQNKE